MSLSEEMNNKWLLLKFKIYNETFTVKTENNFVEKRINLMWSTDIKSPWVNGCDSLLVKNGGFVMNLIKSSEQSPLKHETVDDLHDSYKLKLFISLQLKTFYSPKSRDIKKLDSKTDENKSVYLKLI